MNLHRIRFLTRRVQRLLEAGYALAEAVDMACSGEKLTDEEIVTLEIHVDLACGRAGGERKFLE